MPDPLSDSTLYDLAPELPPRRETKRPAAPTPTASGAPAPLNYRSTPADKRPPAAVETVRDLYLPLWLLGGGVAAEVVAAAVYHGRPGQAIGEVVVNLVVATPLLLVAVVLAARVRQIGLGSRPTALLKLAAVTVAPAAVVDLFGGILTILPFGFVLGWIAQFVLFFALLGALFSLDESDTWYCLCVMFLVRVGFAVVVGLVFR